jgi:hypothetical protein
MSETQQDQTEIPSLADYMAFVQSAQREIRESNSDDLLLFRGQCVDEPLLPKMARLHLLDSRRQEPWRHGLLGTEKRMLYEFRRRAHPFLDNTDKSEWDWLSIAQHHGMDTRLLDWSSNALVGLYFAVEQSIRAEGIVWVLRATPDDVVTPSAELDPYSLPATKFYRPNLLSSRIIAQDGWFSVHKHIKENDSFIALERNRTFRTRLRKLRITGKAHLHLSQLDLCGVNRAALFPGLDGLCAYLNWWRGPDSAIHIRMPRPLPSIDTTSNNVSQGIAHPRRARKL